MKFCTQCGRELADDVQFCTNCGTKCGGAAGATAIVTAEPVRPVMPVEIVYQEPLEDTQWDAPETQKQRKPVRKGKILPILLAILLVAGVAVGGYFGLQWYNSGEQQILRALKAGLYGQVMEILKEDSSLKHSEALEEQLQKRLETLKTDFTAQTMEYAAVLMELDTIAEIGIKDLQSTISETRAYVEKLNASRTAFATAESFFASGAYVEAIAQYKQVIREDSNYETAQTKANEAVALYRTKVLTDAATYAEAEAYENALTLLAAALNNLPGDTQITQQIQLYQKARAESILAKALGEAEKYAAAEDFASAIAVLVQYVRDHGENVDVKLALNNYEGLYNAQILANTLAKAEDYAAGGDYLSAMKTLRTYIDDYGTNASVTAALNGYTQSYVDTVLADAEGKANTDNYPGAITALQTGLVNAPENERLTVRLETYTNTYVANIIAASDALLAEEDYDGAQSLVDAAREILPNNAQLLAQKQAIDKARPKNFVELFDPYQSSKYNEYPIGSTFFMSGVERTNGLLWKEDGYAYFNLGGAYKSLSFDVGHIDGTKMYGARLYIYADGVKILDLAVKADTLPTHVEVNLTGVTQLKIQIDFESLDYGDYGMVDMLIK